MHDHGHPSETVKWHHDIYLVGVSEDDLYGRATSVMAKGLRYCADSIIALFPRRVRNLISPSSFMNSELCRMERRGVWPNEDLTFEVRI
jgi:hypothetical protein